MKTKRLAILSCAALIMGLNFSALGSEHAVTITFTDERTGNDPFSGSWNGGAPISDEGTTQQFFFLSGPPLPTTAHIDHILTGQRGTIHIRSNISLEWSTQNFPNHTGKGRFVIVKGTGDYQKLVGQGTISVTVTMVPSESGWRVTVTGEYVGNVRFRP